MKRLTLPVASTTVALLIAAGALPSCAAVALPDGARGFQGMVRGLVIAKSKKNTLTFKVVRIERTWKNSEARSPEALVGLTTTVKGGEASHAAFLKAVKAGQELSLDVRSSEDGEALVILELTEDQRAMASSKGRGDRADKELKRLRAEIAELRKTVEKLRKENEELKRALKKKAPKD